MRAVPLPVRPGLAPGARRVARRRNREERRPGRWAQCPTGAPASAAAAPMAPASSRQGSVARRSTSSQMAAPTSTPTCHPCDSASPRGTDAPAIAPIAVAPAPVRNAWTPRLARSRVEVGPEDQDERERRREGDERCEEPTADPRRGVADDGDRLDGRARCDLAQRDRVEELPGAHPVEDGDGVVLHQRHDHEAAPIGERADLEGDPRDRGEAPGREGRDAPPPRRGGRDARAGRRRASREELDVPQPAITRTRYVPTVAAATAPMTKRQTQRALAAVAVPALAQLDGRRATPRRARRRGPRRPPRSPPRGRRGAGGARRNTDARR